MGRARCTSSSLSFFSFSTPRAPYLLMREYVHAAAVVFYSRKEPLETPHGVLNNRTWHLSSGCVHVCVYIPLEHSDFLMTTSVAHIHFYAVCVLVCGALVWRARRWSGESYRGSYIEVVLLKPMPHIKPQFKMQLLILWARQITPMVAVG
jgi:hypothetical protein